jgi:RNA polymerase sigma factor FliA
MIALMTHVDDRHVTHATDGTADPVVTVDLDATAFDATATARTDTDLETTAKALCCHDLDNLVREHLPLVGHLVREMVSRLPGHVSREDLTSAGMAALATAAMSYDPSRGIPFAGFATARIRGALLDELRGLDWASRSVRSRARKIETAEQRLTATLGRSPTPQELAESLSVGVDEIRAVNEDVQRAVVLSLQGFAAGTAEDLVAERAAGPEELIVLRERIGYLHDAIEALPERLRQVVTGYFFHERPMADIARELGVTESRVSQLRAEALVLLRDGINAHLDPDLVTEQVRTGSCVLRRRQSYYSAIGERGNLRSRLALTDHDAMRVPVAV